jgi:starch synthase (maltosyl-transferring)
MRQDVHSRTDDHGDERLSHILIEDVQPIVDGGRYPVKRIVGEPCIVEADIFRDGHQIIRAAVKYRRKSDEGFSESPMVPFDNDRWRGEFTPGENTRYVYTIEAWTDLFASWLSDFGKRVRAGRDVQSDLLEGIALLERFSKRARGKDGQVLARCVEQLRHPNGNGSAFWTGALELLSQPELTAAAERSAERSGLTRYDTTLELVADRPKARFSAWYEMFPRSQSPEPGRAGTFADAERRLPVIADMGFDVVYLPPIHPIGTTNRKGPNNSLQRTADSPGSPWAIGNDAGGHDAVDPGLGTIQDFEHFVAVAGSLGIETAIDFAVQCSPDHPWVREHPDWFLHKPDGTIKYAENPPKEYQDIYPIDFDTRDQAGLINELHRIVTFWIDHGVKIFRVDNPHTKPVAFWEWLINRIQESHPEVLFLAEAFTRPKMMKALAKAGFSESYTYFTWRNTKQELTEYLTELTQTPMHEYFRPNFFTNTPDILSPILQSGGRPAFKMRLVLAATLSPAYGIYSGFELCENVAIPGTEEYQNSEKYEIRYRDWHQAGNIREFIARVNQIRRENLALSEFLNLRFLVTDSDDILAFAKSTPDRRNAIIVAVNLDPHNAHYCTCIVPPEVSGAAPGQQYRVTDLLTGATYTWSDRNYVRLDPSIEPAHILRIEARI